MFMCFLSFSFWIESPVKRGTCSLIFGVAFHFSITLNVQFKVVIIFKIFQADAYLCLSFLSSVTAGSEFVYQLSFDSFLHCVTFLLQQLSVRDQVSWCLFFSTGRMLLCVLCERFPLPSTWVNSCSRSVIISPIAPTLPFPCVQRKVLFV